MKRNILSGVIASFLIASLLTACQAQAAPKECSVDITFNTNSASQDWRVINDGVMGGLSSGGPLFENGHMLFEGIINTNGGGFSSIRKDIIAGQLKGAEGLSLRVKSDGRAYKVTMRTDARVRQRPVSFQINIPATPSGEWTDVKAPFSAVKASIFGRPVTGAKFDPAQIQEIGIIIADGTDGPFRLWIDWIKGC